MGKIRIKTFDETEGVELEAKKKAKREAKKAQKLQEKARVSGMGGGQRVKTVGPSVEELGAEEKPATSKDTEEKAAVTEKIDTGVSEKSVVTKKQKKEKFVKEKAISARILENRKLVSKNQTYPMDKAVDLLTKFKTGKFDETVELHVNVREQGVSGNLKLPHGMGKTLKIKIADDALLGSIEQGKIDFDILVATPDMMPKLAKVARILGPKGLMPNPKSGTVTTNPDETVKKLSGGETRFKTEGKAPIIHLRIGKVSFGKDKIFDNLKAAVSAIGGDKIKSATLTSTMTPGIKLQIESN